LEFEEEEGLFKLLKLVAELDVVGLADDDEVCVSQSFESSSESSDGIFPFRRSMYRSQKSSHNSCTFLL
jgi:hypothetical protein